MKDLHIKSDKPKAKRGAKKRKRDAETVRVQNLIDAYEHRKRMDRI